MVLLRQKAAVFLSEHSEYTQREISIFDPAHHISNRDFLHVLLTGFELLRELETGLLV